MTTPAAAFKPCIIIPCYNQPRTVVSVVERVAPTGVPVLVVDDGSNRRTADILMGLVESGAISLVTRRSNGGKGAAVKSGLRHCYGSGFTHALQVDADGQQELERAPYFLSAAQAHPDALVLGCAVGSEAGLRERRLVRKLTGFWVCVQTQSRTVTDAMTGMRVYPIVGTLETQPKGDRMQFDIEVAVRWVWTGAPVINIPIRLRHLTAEDGGVSHFDGLRDNLRISWLHTRLTVVGLVRGLLRLFGAGPKRARPQALPPPNITT